MHTHDGNPSMPGRIARSRPSWTLLLLASSYALLVAGPLWNARGPLASALRDVAGGLPQPLTLGGALLGAAALIHVVGRLVRDVERQPYGAIAPVLAVCSGLVLSGLRAPLPFANVTAPQLGLAGLTLALVGGALVAHPARLAHLVGWALAALPTLLLTLALMAQRGDRSPLAMLAAVDAPLRAYVSLLAVSSLALGLVGRFAHYLRQAAPAAPAPRYESPAAFAASYVPGSYLEPTWLQEQRAPSHGRRLRALKLATLGLAVLAGCFLAMKPSRALPADASSLQAQSSGLEEGGPRSDRLQLEGERTHRPLGTVPIVTSLAPPPGEAAVAEAPDPGRHHPRRPRARRGEAPAVPRSVSRLQASSAKPASTAHNERDLDLDELLESAVRQGHLQAADDPLLGL